MRAGDAIYVRVGDHDLTQKYGSPGAQTLRVATTYIHHNHNSQTLDNDIAILKLHGEADLKEGVCLVCLPARGTSQSAGKKCTVTGYGYMGESKIFSNVQSQLISLDILLYYVLWILQLVPFLCGYERPQCPWSTTMNAWGRSTQLRRRFSFCPRAVFALAGKRDTMLVRYLFLHSSSSHSSSLFWTFLTLGWWRRSVSLRGWRLLRIDRFSLLGIRLRSSWRSGCLC